ncbi:hypothetical protein JG687_00014508 [Phytophthora cactorum]|uniref:Uncharacterized protein n=2 Tax=Phytophthora cactorum TaxID=29920 RepID=A0A329SRQ1_9STRA|nr:hypothetical protein Pcac1_g22138 [Phytophthora cactorum]KAG2809404.1 hypothetical protein PC111_g16065 [Phytophthora cactorum]KAG2818069.1 hypothetical protein PC112_g12787 [Phytophthora cactorum]KAG2854383.1 hypothetical protein PC113_g13355 [Phytophthora cactorum]KAG2895108.1 hypothetical protein PC114_g15613 [Phytophthora cactorum]
MNRSKSPEINQQGLIELHSSIVKPATSFFDSTLEVAPLTNSTMADDRFLTSTVEQEEIDYLRGKGLLRSDIEFGMDRQQQRTFGQAFDAGANLTPTFFEPRNALQQ